MIKFIIMLDITVFTYVEVNNTKCKVKYNRYE